MLCSWRLCPSPGIYAVTSYPFVNRTRATLRKAEFGFLGVVVYTRVHTPRFWGFPSRAGAFLRFPTCLRPLRTSWLIVGNQSPAGTGDRRRALRSARHSKPSEQRAGTLTAPARSRLDDTYAGHFNQRLTNLHPNSKPVKKYREPERPTESPWQVPDDALFDHASRGALDDERRRMRPQPERAKRGEVGDSQSPCALRVTAPRGHLRRCRSSPIRTVSRRRAALDLWGHPPQAGPALVTWAARVLQRPATPAPSAPPQRRRSPHRRPPPEGRRTGRRPPAPVP